MQRVIVGGPRYRRAAEEEEREKERPVPPPPSHHSSHQFNSIKNKFFNELTHLPSKNLGQSINRCVLLYEPLVNHNINQLIITHSRTYHFFISCTSSLSSFLSHVFMLPLCCPLTDHKINCKSISKSILSL